MNFWSDPHDLTTLKVENRINFHKPLKLKNIFRVSPENSEYRCQISVAQDNEKINRQTIADATAQKIVWRFYFSIQ